MSGIDPRGPQFNAALTSLVLAVALVLPTSAAAVIVAAQAVPFALGVVLGVQRTPAAWLFRRLIRPRLSPPVELEDPAPPRFAQAVGLVFTLVALTAYVGGLTVVAQVAVGLALVAALLNAVFRLCLGCELYLLFRRVVPLVDQRAPASTVPLVEQRAPASAVPLVEQRAPASAVPLVEQRAQGGAVPLVEQRAPASVVETP